MRFCNECKEKRRCNKFNNQINENKEFEANLNLLKREAPNEFGYMLPYYNSCYMTTIMKMIQESVINNVFVKLLQKLICHFFIVKIL